jgi:hypothetical protein
MSDSYTIWHCDRIRAKVRSYVIGETPILQPVGRQGASARLRLAVRVVIFQSAPDEVCLSYVLPSSMMSQRQSGTVAAAALRLDAKLRSLASSSNEMKARSSQVELESPQSEP